MTAPIPADIPDIPRIPGIAANAAAAAVTARRAWTARHPLRASVTACTLLYVVGGSLVYHLLLADNPTTFSMTGAAGQATGPLTGWHALTSLLLHTVIPVAVAVDWLLL